MKAQFPWDATKSQAKFFITEINVLSDTIKINKMTFIWHEDLDMHRYLSADINCSKKHLQFFESIAQGNPFTSQNRHCPRTNIWAYFHTKWWLLCLLIIFELFFCNTHGFENWGIFLKSHDMFRPIVSGRKYYFIDFKGSHSSWSDIPAILALYANPTPHKLLLAAPAITPAHMLPCLGSSTI